MKFITPALVAIVGLALCAPVTVSAQSNTVATTAPVAKAKAASKTKKTEYQGTLTTVDAASVTVQPKKGAALTLAIAATTKIKKDKKAATLADFAVGDKVTGSYTKDAAGTMTAASLYTKSAAAKAATPAAPAAAQ